MDFSFSEDQQALRELARKILEDRAGHERLKEVEASAERVDRALWQELAHASLLGVAVGEAYGGSGLGWAELALLLIEAGRTTAPVPLLSTLAQGALAIERFGDESLRAHWLPRVVAGEALLAVALDEPDAAEPGAPRTRARREGRGWRVDGAKSLVAGAHVAARVLLPARSQDGVAVFLLDPAAQGVRSTRQETTTGEPRFDLTLSNVAIAAEDVLAGPERGAEATRALLEHGLAGQCALLLGVAERALAHTAAYTSERRQFERPIGSFQAVHQRAADAYIDLEAMRLTLWQAVHRLVEGDPASEALAVAKYWAASAGHRVTYAAQHLHGGIGLDVDYPLHRHYLHARQLALELGSASEHLAQLGNLLAGDRA